MARIVMPSASSASPGGIAVDGDGVSSSAGAAPLSPVAAAPLGVAAALGVAEPLGVVVPFAGGAPFAASPLALGAALLAAGSPAPVSSSEASSSAGFAGVALARPFLG